MATTEEKKLIDGYRRLHDRLSIMIEGGRLSYFSIPDDYKWLVDSLAKLGGLDAKVKAKASFRFANLRVGDSFVFEPEGPVFVRCRGGYRSARGGSIYASMDVAVYRYIS